MNAIEQRREEDRSRLRLWERTLEDKRKNAVVFYGNHAHPLPEELFRLWHDLMVTCGDLQLTWMDVTLESPAQHARKLTWDEGEQIYHAHYWNGVQDFHAWDSSVAISLYTDHEIGQKLFWIALSKEGILSPHPFDNRNTASFLADERLIRLYTRWAGEKQADPDKWSQKRKKPKHAYEELMNQGYMEIYCTSCPVQDDCYRTHCLQGLTVEDIVPGWERFKVNFHILEPCNYRCRHCFAHFDNERILPVQTWKHIADNCAHGIFVREVNIAGGEPLLYPDLDELIRYITDVLHIRCSIITNGYFMTERWIQENAPRLATIGFSVDSVVPENMLAMGRADPHGNYLSKERLDELCRMIKAVNPECMIKVNTVVTKLNQDEDLLREMEQLPVDRWKIIKMRVFRSGTFDNSDIAVTDEEYAAYCARNTAGCEMLVRGSTAEASDILRKDKMKIIIERSTEGGYILVDANGYLVDNAGNDNYIPLIDCACEDFEDGFQRLKLDRELYFSRYRQ